MGNRYLKQKSIFTMIIIIGILSISGCQNKGLSSYQEALKTTNSIDKGEITIEVDTNFNFDKTGLTFEEEKVLSDFESMSGKLTTKFDESKELMETNIYYIQGGMGIDFSLFLKDQQLILQLPIINLFMILQEEDMMNFQDNEEFPGSEQGGIASQGLMIDFDQLLNDWISVFKEEDVVVGNNTYVLTNEGQLKTTKYSFNLDSDQLKILEEQLFLQIDMEKLSELVLSQINEYNDETMTFDINEMIKKIKLGRIEGEAFVDFDNHLIRQNFVLYGQGVNVGPGDLETFEIKLSMTYANLGEEQAFEFPTLTEETIVDQKELEEIFDTFIN